MLYFQEIFKIHYYHPKYIENREGNNFFFESLLDTRQCAQSFHLFLIHRATLERQVLLLPPFTDEENEARKEDE